jgi:hypothetical protein
MFPAMGEKRAMWWVYLGSVLALAPLIYLAKRHLHLTTLFWIFDHVELVGIGGLAVYLALVATSTSKLPLDGLPWEAPWWKFLLFGVELMIFSVVALAATLCAVVAIPILLPIKLLMVRVLGRSATIAGALLSFPLILASTSVTFAALYGVAIGTGKGNLVRDRVPLYDKAPGKPWPLGEVYYFSLSTMVKGSTQYDATGWCRWLALLQVTLARLLEVAVVTIGIGAILRRAAGH